MSHILSLTSVTFDVAKIRRFSQTRKGNSIFFEGNFPNHYLDTKKMLRGTGKDMPNDPKTGSIARIWSLFRGYNGASFPMKWSLFSGAAEHLFKVSGILFSLACGRVHLYNIYGFVRKGSVGGKTDKSAIYIVVSTYEVVF